ncbi:hypothetical protein DMB95_02825 [Campylobacter sp. MIT 12-8780]|uniref:sulfatase-like hydrolase/transferase n=1 Tax=Campylobacter sp. MIT 12-8780 TaxID=2202200 RepID=UPI00115E1DD4|nr:sulfatase-like hydrolase/transferase [Campylobacter sp. MIT 12-8780]TQR41863.1 hypothetical protein DMB95_02825 [Campylobacter sp. MIT 12-8780]
MFLPLQHKFKFILIVVLFNIPLAFYPLFLYALNLTFNGSSVYFLCAGVAHFYLYFFLINLVLAYPLFLVLKNKMVLAFFITCLINIFAHIILLTDAHIFYLYRFHLSFAMLDLFFNAGGEVISLSTQTVLAIIIKVLVIIFYVVFASLFALYLAQNKSHKRFFVLVLPLMIVLYLSVNFIHALSMAKQDLAIINLANRLPLYKPLTMNSFLRKFGIVAQEGQNEKFKVLESGYFDYPKKPLEYEDASLKYNVLLLLSDSLRADMLNATNMPFTTEFAKNASVYTNHYSSSNSTRGGIFGLFYGLPPSYWQVALTSGKSAALIQAVKDQNYSLGVFTTANLYKPEFHQTIFAAVENLRMGSKGETFLEREENTIEDFHKFIQNHDKNKRFFSFVFLDNIHAYTFPDEFARFKPYSSINHLSLNAQSDASEYFNLYQNAVLYTDANFKRIIEILKENQLYENTIIIISADHGEEFNEDKDNHWGHNSDFKDYQVKIPLIVKWGEQNKSATIHTKTSVYDISTTLMQEVFRVKNNSLDYSIGENLFHLTNRPYVLAGSYTENAVIEDERIVLINALGLLEFKDKKYQDSNNTSKKNLFEIFEIFSRYLKKE